MKPRLFRENIKSQLRDYLLCNGFRGDHIDAISNVFYKTTIEVRIINML